MADGLEWVLQFESQVSEIKKSVSALESLDKTLRMADGDLKKLEKDFDGGLKAGTDKLSGGIEKIGKSAEGSSVATGAFFGSFAGNIAAQAVGAITSLAGAFVHLGMSALEAAGQAQRTETAFHLMLGVKPGDELMDWMEEISQITEFTGGQMKEFGLELTRAGFSGERLKGALAAGADMAAMSGKGIAGMTDAIGMLGRINLKGGISEKDLVGLGVNPKEFFTKLAADMGTSVAVVEKRLQSGKIAVDDVLESLYTSITAKTGKALGAAGEDASKGFASQLEKLKDVPGNIMESLSKTEGFEQITGFVTDLQKALSGDLGKKLMDQLAAVAGKVGSFLQGVDIAAVIDNVSGKLEGMFAILQGGWAVIEGITWLFTGIGNELGETSAKVYLFGVAVVDAFMAVKTWTDNAIDTLFALPEKFYELMLSAGTSVWQGLRDGILGGVSAVTDAVGGLADSVIGSFKGLLGIASPSKLFAAFGEMTAEGFTMGLEVAAPSVEGAVNSTFGVTPPSASIDASAGASLGGAGGEVNLGGFAVNVNVAGTNATAEDIATEVALRTPSLLQIALEQFRLEMGLA